MKFGAKVVRHGRYITFQMAEVAIPRTLFVEILRLISAASAIASRNSRRSIFTSSRACQRSAGAMVTAALASA